VNTQSGRTTFYHSTTITKYRRNTLVLVELKVAVVRCNHEPTAKRKWWGSARRVSFPYLLQHAVRCRQCGQSGVCAVMWDKNRLDFQDTCTTEKTTLCCPRFYKQRKKVKHSLVFVLINTTWS